MNQPVHKVTLAKVNEFALRPGGRHKTGGRTAGKPNKATREVTELLAELGCNPIAGMAAIAMNDSHAPELRGKMFSDLARYVYPQRKAVELSSADEGPLEVRVSWRDSRPPPQ